ncbi:MAG TPA: YidC/Oxa1 family insertase periplasmic-domain containing protein, partial [Thermoanaerobaculia bacterium]|nr:YidC/Oxa1 family insertase periplasmic-domain containing protein [Thermoanaerobaculia bacterium]
ANTSLYLVEEMVERRVTTLTYRYQSERGEEIRKVFRLGPAYQFDFDVRLTGTEVPYRVAFGPGIRTSDTSSKDTQFLTTGNGVTQIDDSLDVLAREKAPPLAVFQERVAFIGIEDNYFLVAIKPAVAGNTIFRSVLVPTGPNIEQGRREIYAAVNSLGGRVAGNAFFGPKQADILEAYGLEKTLKFGWFGLIGRFLLTALIWFYSYIGNYGWAIVALTVVIKLLLYPLQHKAIVSMKKMQSVQPKVNALKDKYKKAKTDAEQRQKMNVEMMKLYQQEGINPMSGCLPILLQLPILWAFYGLLSNAIELRGAEFIGWIRDLSAPDPYYITPILMTATMFIQQWMTPTTLDPMQRRIFMVLPLVFGFIFKDFPSGLVLYWLVQNVLTIAQQAIMNRYWKEHPLEVSK